MIIYRVGIGHVDGITSYDIVSTDPKECISFLELHDHEGSSISLQIEDLEIYNRTFKSLVLEKDIYNENVYKRLEV